MTILNETEMNAVIANLADGVANKAAKVRSIFTDMLQSLQSYGGVLSDGNVVDIGITENPVLWTHYTDAPTSPNLLLEANLASNLIRVKEPALYFLTFRFQGSWAANEDLKFLMYVNGVPNVITPVQIEQEGQGASDPIILSVTDIAFIVNSAMIAAGPGGNYAEVGVFASSDTGPFDVDQEAITFGLEYNPLSIRTVG